MNRKKVVSFLLLSSVLTGIFLLAIYPNDETGGIAITSSNIKAIQVQESASYKQNNHSKKKQKLLDRKTSSDLADELILHNGIEEESAYSPSPKTSTEFLTQNDLVTEEQDTVYRSTEGILNSQGEYETVIELDEELTTTIKSPWIVRPVTDTELTRGVEGCVYSSYFIEIGARVTVTTDYKKTVKKPSEIQFTCEFGTNGYFINTMSGI